MSAVLDRPAAAPVRSTRSSRTGYSVILLLSSAALLASIAAAVSFGSVRIPIGDVWAIVAHRLAPGAFESWWTEARAAIVVDSRLPRSLTAAVVGASLALAGGVAQAVTRNPLADPYLLGVSSGAGFGVVMVMTLGIGAGALGAFTVPGAAFVGALIPLFLALAIGGRYPQSTAIVLVGVAVGSVFTALITLTLLVFADERSLSGVMHWLAGGFGDARWSTLVFPVLALLCVGILVMMSAPRMDLLKTGDDGAAALGMNVRRFRMMQLLAISLLAGAAVSVSGGIGFVGLLVPHLAGYVVGTRAVRLLPVAALFGAIALVGADTLARSITQSTEVPVGVITALVGAPIFVFMLYRRYAREIR
ncbi:iron ABC transporter permease [Rhodococcus sp. 15-2388-1-1a]|jgi:iron complex transport system permease protein|uniref:FecCD family ABC transporter permease n=1 Tax=Nocardiaceae TaxID=85025 RepID=UPI0005601D25|nr:MULTISPECIES: iron ABC transporter permease [Rhodococcus]OZE93051.1 iron ABC transporter permease [Rhodococcus sp. 15-2388-1-1a]